ncbi:probable cytochrome P450 49a1 [Toxorhynchites rutilus septentrionalis]|uniref:probable cytochrome P450 49a1 n=1 Tax=Toxorhynchites rutilus septentrionalis TaxID=329112 RepID=UPI002478F20C|nr:probable cytochrome P450 49a1 [Toxorhynchites rutilus septentrionalis]
MVGQRIANSLLKRSAFSSAINVLPNEVTTAAGTAPAIATTVADAQTGVEFAVGSHVKSYMEVPGPKGLPLIGNSWRFAPFVGQYRIEDLDKVMRDLHLRFGKVAKVGGLIGHPDLLFVYDADLIRDTFKKEEVQPHRPAMPSLRNYKSKLRKEFFGDNMGLIGVHGEKWDAFRAKVQQVMLQPATAKKYIGPLDEISSDFMERIHEMRDNNDELPGDFLHELYKWALESIGRVALDTRLGCVSKTGNEESKRIIDSINAFFWNVAEVELRMPIWRIYKTSAYKKYISALDTFRELCMRHINIAMEKMNSSSEVKSEENISLVERILQKTNNPKIAAVLALDLIMVGVDTTSVAATSTIYQLSQNPDKQEILFNEIKRSLPSPDTKFTVSMLEAMPYLRACIKETLRMYPVVIGNGRSLQSDAIIGGYHIPKGTHVIFPHFVVSNLEEYFPEPEKFVPERWLKRGELKEHGAGCPLAGQKIHPYVSLPFGYGRRTCIGRRFAESELLILLSKLFRRYHIEYNYEKLTYKVNPTYIPDKPLKFKLTERNN